MVVAVHIVVGVSIYDKKVEKCTAAVVVVVVAVVGRIELEEYKYFEEDFR